MIQPAPDAAPPSPEVEPQEQPQAPQLSDKLLKLPAIQALFAGAPPALSAPVKEFTVGKRDEAKLIKENLPALQEAGMGFYQSINKHLGVIFNQLHVHLADLQAADKAGKLTQLAPDFDHINHAVSKSGTQNPVLHVRGVPGGFKSPTPQAPPQMAPGAPGQAEGPSMAPPVSAGPPAPASVQRKLNNARLTNLQPGAPTSGPSPGAGRLLNAILKPVV